MSTNTILTTKVPGLDDAITNRLVDGLNQNLANLTDFATAYKQAHWNVVGIQFSQLHELFDTFAAQVRDYIDQIAERAVTVGGVAHGTLQAAVQGTALPPFPLEERGERQLLDELLKRIDTVDAQLRRAMDETADEPATQDLYIEVVRGIEKQRWMLQAHLAG